MKILISFVLNLNLYKSNHISIDQKSYSDFKYYSWEAPKKPRLNRVKFNHGSRNRRNRTYFSFSIYNSEIGTLVIQNQKVSNSVICSDHLKYIECKNIRIYLVGWLSWEGKDIVRLIYVVWTSHQFPNTHLSRDQCKLDACSDRRNIEELSKTVKMKVWPLLKISLVISR